MIYNLDIQTNENAFETYNVSNCYNKGYDNNSSQKDFNYKEIDNLIFCPILSNENEFTFFRQTLEIFKSENKEMFYNYYNNLPNEEKKQLQEIIEISKEPL